MNNIILLILCCSATLLHTSEHCSSTNCYINGFIGGISGAASMTVYAPWSYFQNRKIQQLPIEWKKPHYWFRGYPTLALNNAPVIAIQSAGYKYIMTVIKNNNKELACSDTIFAASVAGGLSAPVNNTSQLITLHQQNNGLSILQTINKFPNSYRSLHRGTIPAMYRGFFFANGYINCLPFIKEHVYQQCSNNTLAIILSAIFSSILITSITQPMQVIITTLHADIEKKHYTGMMQACKKLVSTKGLRALYQGAYYRTMGNVLAIPVLNYVQQTLNALK